MDTLEKGGDGEGEERRRRIVVRGRVAYIPRAGDVPLGVLTPTIQSFAENKKGRF
jgi:hypothetical protein